MNDTANLTAAMEQAGDAVSAAFGDSLHARLAIAVVIVLIGLLAWGALARWGARIVRTFTGRTKSWFDDALVESLEGPVKIVPVLVATYIAAAVIRLEGPLREAAEKAMASAAIVLVFWTLIGVIDRVLVHSDTLKKALAGSVMEWTRAAARWLLIFICAAAVLEEWGIAVAPILAGLGIFGAAVALGAQDLFKNLIGGIVILVEDRFNPGDWILVDGVVEGTVEQIGFRSTRVRRFDKGPVFVPNAKLADNAVTNFSRMSHRRIYWKIGLLYSTTSEQLRKVRDLITAFVMEDERFAKPPDVPTF
ncbi:MAG: mechanosensitive ion channel family protein, partial [Caulobacterales bacterium]|nr:mechanosensitive ion channel family protein [Caulobacterales bacterium]